MKKTIRFLITGVGGQGTILASDILAEVGLRLGHAQGEEQAVQRHGQRDGQAVAPGPPVEQLLRPQKGRIDAPALGQGVKLLCKRGDLCTGQLLPEGEQSVQIGVQLVEIGADGVHIALGGERLEHLNMIPVVVPPAADLAVHVLHLFIMRVHQLALVGFELFIHAAGKKAHALTSQ